MTEAQVLCLAFLPFVLVLVHGCSAMARRGDGDGFLGLLVLVPFAAFMLARVFGF